MNKEKAVFCWSGGKDSALALYKVRMEDKVEIMALLTTVNANYRRISMHGVREELLEQQAAAIGLPLTKVYVSEGSNEEYERTMESTLLRFKEQGVTKVIFGDIFLEDLRAYREKNLLKVGLKAEFPLWKRNTKELVEEFITLNFRTITCCVNSLYLKEAHVGVEIDSEFLRTLPGTVDPCGENGEFHSFCFDGPLFRKAVPFVKGEKVFRPLEIKQDDNTEPANTGFWFCELLPLSGS
ncbi:MAG: diphthine--ammonia ligase [Bacteroidia bacterium]